MSNDNKKIIASDIYERQQIDAEYGPGHGSVYDDIEDLDFFDMEEYFGDLDPTEFL